MKGFRLPLRLNKKGMRGVLVKNLSAELALGAWVLPLGFQGQGQYGRRVDLDSALYMGSQLWVQGEESSKGKESQRSSN